MTTGDVIRILLVVYVVAITGYWVFLAVAVRSSDPASRISRLRSKLASRVPYIPSPTRLFLADDEALPDVPVNYWPAYLPTSRRPADVDHQADELGREIEEE